MVFQEQVLLVVESMVKNAEKVREFSDSLKQMGQDTQAMQQELKTFGNVSDQSGIITERFTKQFDSFRGVMTATDPVFNLLNQNVVRFNSIGGRMAMTLRRMQMAQQKLVMTMLGVMFFGMAMTRMFSGMLNPAAEAFGIFEIWSTMLMVVFLPIMEALFPYFLSFIEFFMNLSPEAKMAIGVIAMVGLVIGKLLAFIGMAAIGFNALIPVFGAIGTAISTVGTWFAGLGAVVTIAFAVILALVIGFFLAWKENFLGIQEFVLMIWEGIKDTFAGVVQILSGLLDILVGFFTGDFSKIREGFIKLWKGFVNVLKGAVKIVVGLLATLGISVIRFFKIFFDWGYKIGEFLGDIFGDLVLKGWEMGKNLITRMIEGIVSTKDKLVDAILGLLPNWAIKAVNKVFGGGGGGDSDSGIKSFNDMIWRPGSDPISISPQDTLVATKGGLPQTGNTEQTINITNNNSINVLDKAELQRILDDRDRKIMDDLRRLVRG